MQPKDERKYYGTNACYALSKQRPNDIKAVYVDRNEERTYFQIMQRSREKSIPVKVVAEADLERLTKSTHHQGICIVAKEKPQLDFARVFPVMAKSSEVIIFLDGVENPHNVGAILRTASHFGIRYILGNESLPRFSPSACRTSEGGAEFVELVRCGNPVAALQDLKKSGFRVLASSSSSSAKSLQKYMFPAKSVLIFGSEVYGISEPIQLLADDSICISGSGAVQSMNVSVVVAIFLHEVTRQLLQK